MTAASSNVQSAVSATESSSGQSEALAAASSNSQANALAAPTSDEAKKQLGDLPGGNSWSANIRLNSRYILVAFGLIAFIRGLTWSAMILPLYGCDEPQHFMYARELSQHLSYTTARSMTVPKDVSRLVNIFGWAKNSRRAVSTSNPDAIRQEITSIDQSSRGDCGEVVDPAYVIVTKQYFKAEHPPLYYALLAPVIGACKNFGLLWQLFAGRFLAVVFGVITMLASFQIGKLIWQQDDTNIRPLTLAALVSFQPMSAFSFATISNCSLEITLYSLLLLVCVQSIYFGMTRARGITLATIVLAGLATKYSFAATIPLIAMLLHWHWTRGAGAASEKKHKSVIKPLLIALGAGSAIAIPALFWLTAAGGRGTLAEVFEYFHNPPTAGLNLLGYFRRSDSLLEGFRIIGTYWGSYPWHDAHLSSGSVVTLTALSAGAIFYATSWLRRNSVSNKDSKEQNDRQQFAVLFLMCSALILVLFYAGLDFLMYMLFGVAGHFSTRGQYYIPAVSAEMMILILAAERLLGGITRMTTLSCVWLCVLMIALNCFCLYEIILPHSVQGHGLLQQVSQMGLFLPSPLNGSTLLGMNALFMIASGIVPFLILLSSRIRTVDDPNATYAAHS